MTMFFMEPKISLIAAIGKNGELGKDNKLLWHIPEDLKRFKELTLGHVIIMGRRTYESIGHPLPNRINMVITHDPTYDMKGTGVVCASLTEAITMAQDREVNEIFIIGGGQIFTEAMPLADKLYLTIIDKTFDADVFFPDYSAFTKEVFKEEGKSGDLTYAFIDLVK